ncbi:MAG: sensor histidine kinase [Flavobacteriales bacterium]|nr:MAG: sensor histidine kinase [Flavobacteriales bacterium]
MSKEPIIGHIPGPREDRGFWLDLSLAIVVAAGWALLYYQYVHLRDDRRERTLMHAQARLDRLEGAMDAHYGKVLDDLREYGTWFSAADTGSFTTQRLLRPLVPYLRRNNTVRAVRLANDAGDHFAITNLDTALLVTEMRGHDSTFLQWALKGSAPPDTLRRWDADWNDVRSLPWFGNAVNDASNEVSWTQPYPLPGAGSLGFTASLALRGGRNGVSVLAMDIAFHDPRQQLMPKEDISGPWLFVLGADGHRLAPVQGAPQVEAALLEWEAKRRPPQLWSTAGNEPILACIRPYVLGNSELQVGVAAPLEPYGENTREARYLLIAEAGFMAFLSALMVAAYSRRRRESTEHRQQQERSRSQRQRLAKAIGEREVLNREVHHRVKNNLQVVTSLLNLQLRKLEDGPVKDEFLRGVRRIDNMAIVHHKLYGLQDLRGIDLNSFFAGLVDHIAATTDTSGTTVSCAIDTNGIKADADTAIELGVILNELVGNCYQHAFPFATGGHIEVQVRQVDGDLYRLVVKDNGQGWEARPQEGTGKLGLEVVDALAFQLDGNLKVSSSGGTTFDVLFRMIKPVKH